MAFRAFRFFVVNADDLFAVNADDFLVVNADDFLVVNVECAGESKQCVPAPR